MSNYPRIVHVMSGGCLAKYAVDGPWVNIQVALPPKVECKTKSDRARDALRARIEARMAKHQLYSFHAETQRLEEAFIKADKRAKLLAAAFEITKINEQARRADIRRYAAKSCYYVLMTILYGLLAVAAFVTPFTLFSLSQIGQAFVVMLLLFSCGVVGAILATKSLIRYVAAHLSASIAIQKERS